jgi:hypothetical protein
MLKLVLSHLLGIQLRLGVGISYRYRSHLQCKAVQPLAVNSSFTSSSARFTVYVTLCMAVLGRSLLLQRFYGIQYKYFGLTAVDSNNVSSLTLPALGLR